MLDIVFGSSGQNVQEAQLRESLQFKELSGTLYFSYPMFDDVEGQNSADALLVSDEHGLTLFDLTAPNVDLEDPQSWFEEIERRQDEIYRNVTAKLLQNRDLVAKRKLVIEPNIVTIIPDTHDLESTEELSIVTPAGLPQLLETFDPLPEQHERALNASIQRISTIKPKVNRSNVVSEGSLGYIVKEIEKNIANLDAWQKRSAIAYPEGPQRIRGLAGSGKTIVLALKAAYLHAKHPEWNIAVTYYSRSLQQQFRDLIRRFMYETKRDEPDWSKIHIMHSWGGRGEAGAYSEITKHVGIHSTGWGVAKQKYGDKAFEGVCDEVVKAVANQEPKPLFDAVLIDEAQDLPTSFFKMIYAVTSSPKRIVWAYDELQNLGDYSMPSPSELFGEDSFGLPRVSLENQPNRPPQDIILPICYRNTPWALTVAHGLGFGVYRNVNEPTGTPLVQMFDQPSLWEEIGYECVAGDLSIGSHVRIKRKSDCTPPYYSDPEKRLIEPEDAVQFYSFKNSTEQARWIAKEVKENLTTGELLHSDILIILPSAWTSKSEYAVLSAALREYKIPSHLVGISSSREEVFVKGSVAITHIYRAKGNEAPMVYCANSNECVDGLQLAKKRNTLFTAMTRSRAWVRVCGIGEASNRLNLEFEKIRDNDFQLEFDYPNEDQLKRMRRVHRDRSVAETKKLNQKISGFTDVLQLIESGEVPVDSLPAELIDGIRKIISEH